MNLERRHFPSSLYNIVPNALHSLVFKDFEIQWSAVRVTAVTVIVGYSDILGNP